MQTVLMLVISNAFMTIAWYWHLRGGMTKPLFAVILISWSIAFVEYCFAVPANRIGYASGWTPAQLKITQEVITLGVFALFAVLWLKEPLHWRYFAAVGCMVAAVALVFSGK
jgi:uncharacterized protein (DUF486 family)